MPSMLPTKHCPSCGTVLGLPTAVCPACGVLQPTPPGFDVSEQTILPTALLCLVFGVFGVHRFYVGKVRSGLLQLLTLGGFGIWAMVDLIVILTGHFTDGEGYVLREWT